MKLSEKNERSDMVVNIVNLLSKALVSNKIQAGTAITRTTSKNPFANPFVTSSTNNYSSYAKNNPVQGGYFAGYYNGKTNIVGKRLFIEA